MKVAADPALLGFDPARLSRIDDWMARNEKIGRYTGSSVLIAREGEIAYLGCSGMASVAEGRKYAPDTIVRIYSMTKAVTSVVMMMLVERGLVHLDAPVAQFIPEFADTKVLKQGATSIDQVEPAEVPITLHQLLTHTSGLTYGFNEGVVPPAYAEGKLDFIGSDKRSLANTARAVAALPLVFQPGSAWEYSVGIDVIGRVIEVITGKPLDQVFQEEIFEPLGMVDTGFSIPDDKLDRFADCYVWTEADPLHCLDRATKSSFSQSRVKTFSGGGGLVSTLEDYFRFGELLRTYGRHGDQVLLAPNTVAFMRDNHLTGDIASLGATSFAEMPMTGMGFGIGGAVVLDPARSRVPGSVGDFGWGGMASTYYWTDPEEDLTCIFFTQLVPSSTYPNRAELKALVHGALLT